MVHSRVSCQLSRGSSLETNAQLLLGKLQAAQWRRTKQMVSSAGKRAPNTFERQTNPEPMREELLEGGRIESRFFQWVAPVPYCSNLVWTDRKVHPENLKF
jgi:hypothetical protein